MVSWPAGRVLAARVLPIPAVPFIPGSFSSSASSPPSHSSSGVNLLSASALTGGAGPLSSAYSRSSIVRKPADEQVGPMLGSGSKLEPSKSNPEMDSNPTIFIRKLPRNTGVEALRSMLLFAKDLIDVDFVAPEYSDDQNYASATARFRTIAGAHEAKERLHGKINAAGDATMLVDVYQHGLMGAFGGRRNTIDMSAMRHGSTANLPMPAASTDGNRQSSRFNGIFQPLERRSPPSANEQFSQSDLTAHNIQGLFSPKPPLGSHYVPNKDSYPSSEAMINDIHGDAEDETGKILSNPVEYAINGETHRNPRTPRNNSLTGVFGNLSLKTQPIVTSPPINNLTSTRLMSNLPRQLQSPSSGISPRTTLSGGSHSFTSLSNTSATNNSFTPGPYGARHQYPRSNQR